MKKPKDELVDVSRPGGYPQWVTKEEAEKILAGRLGSEKSPVVAAGASDDPLP